MDKDRDDRDEQDSDRDGYDDAQDGKEHGTDIFDGGHDGVAQACGGDGGEGAGGDGGSLDGGGGTAACDERCGPLEHGVDGVCVKAELGCGDQCAGDGGGWGGERVEGVVKPGDVIGEGLGECGDGE